MYIRSFCRGFILFYKRKWELYLERLSNPDQIPLKTPLNCSSQQGTVIVAKHIHYIPVAGFCVLLWLMSEHKHNTSKIAYYLLPWKTPFFVSKKEITHCVFVFYSIQMHRQIYLHYFSKQTLSNETGNLYFSNQTKNFEATY